MINIDIILKKSKLSKQDLAKRMGISRENLYRILNGNPTLQNLEKLSEALGIEPWQLFTESPYAGPDGKLYGVVVFDGTPYRIQSIEDLEKLIELAKE